MGRKIIRWNVTKMVWMIQQILQNKFDCFIVIEGNRGLGKSTLAIHLARKISTAMKNQEAKDYHFTWNNSLVYTQKETKHFLHSWREIGIVDEAINVAFNRDFYQQDQNDIIKLINMNRDHCNLFIACVPAFQTLDAQVKNLCKIRITVVRRGMCIIQAPNQTICIKDKWDTATNEKIEREWLKKGKTNPQYSRLTTFRGLMKFSALSDRAEGMYQKVKDRKRNLVAKEEMGIIDDDEKEKDPVAIIVERMKEGRVRNQAFLDGFAEGHGFVATTFSEKVRRSLKKTGDNTTLSSYFWDKKGVKINKEALC